MIRSLPRSRLYRIAFMGYVLSFFCFLLIPLFAICVLAFNDSDFISLPWQGFSLDWFFSSSAQRVGLFADEELLASVYTSLSSGFFVAIFSTFVGTLAALLFELTQFRLKGVLYFLALSPLVIPGVILGISILLSATAAGNALEERWGLDVELLRPSYWLVIIGQFSFATTYVMLLVSARLKKFDPCLEEAALSLRASQLQAIWFITLPFLRPAIMAAFLIAFILSFANINTTIFLIGSDPTLPIDLYSRIRFSSTPVLNAVSFMIVLMITFFAIANVFTKAKVAT